MSRADDEVPELAQGLARPDAGHGPGVLVLACSARERDWVEEACARLARHGFVALGAVAASDDSPCDAPTDAEQRCVAASEACDAPTDAEQRCVDAALDALFRDPCTDGARVGALGLGRGAALALDAAARGGRVATLVGFGGAAGIAALEVAAPVPLLLVVGEKAPDAAPEALAALDARQGEAPGFGLRILPGAGEGCFDPARADRYDAVAARAGWDAALARLLAEIG